MATCTTTTELLEALKKAEKLLVAAYGDPEASGTDNVISASVIRLARANIAKATAEQVSV